MGAEEQRVGGLTLPGRGSGTNGKISYSEVLPGGLYLHPFTQFPEIRIWETVAWIQTMAMGPIN